MIDNWPFWAQILLGGTVAVLLIGAPVGILLYLAYKLDLEIKSNRLGTGARFHLEPLTVFRKRMARPVISTFTFDFKSLEETLYNLGLTDDQIGILMDGDIDAFFRGNLEDLATLLRGLTPGEYPLGASLDQTDAYGKKFGLPGRVALLAPRYPEGVCTELIDRLHEEGYTDALPSTTAKAMVYLAGMIRGFEHNNTDSFNDGFADPFGYTGGDSEYYDRFTGRKSLRGGEFEGLFASGAIMAAFSAAMANPFPPAHYHSQQIDPELLQSGRTRFVTIDVAPLPVMIEVLLEFAAANPELFGSFAFGEYWINGSDVVDNDEDGPTTGPLKDYDGTGPETDK